MAKFFKPFNNLRRIEDKLGIYSGHLGGKVFEFLLLKTKTISEASKTAKQIR